MNRLLFLFLACRAAALAAESGGTFLEVPFVVQEREYCGPACLAMVFNYYGVEFDQESLAREVYRPELDGSLNLDLLQAARRHGFDAEAFSGSRDDIFQALDAGAPVIVQVLVPGGSGNYHFMVVRGYDRESRTLTVHSGRSRDLRLEWDAFGRDWDGSGNWMLVVRRKTSWP
ncbi:MAG TPA: C39 family peptidase [bacterium]|nr:C39 family peptidase [bacterium]HPJ73009.1 C39 family peptidase [bacterium]HPQ67217.1 C39 family peptidase [bacterium]